MTQPAPEHYRIRVVSTSGALHKRSVAQRHYRCDGHMASERHFIQAGSPYVASALPPDNPDIGNTRWWHARYCMDCAPIETVTPA